MTRKLMQRTTWGYDAFRLAILRLLGLLWGNPLSGRRWREGASNVSRPMPAPLPLDFSPPRHPPLRLLRVPAWIESHPNLGFWLLFGSLNLFLFLPSALLEQGDATFWATFGQTWRDPNELWRLLAIWRPTPDVIRLQLEFLLLVVLLTAIRPLRRPLVRGFVLVVYLLTLIYAVYESVMRSLYQMEPVFYSQYRMLTEGLAFVLESMTLPIYYWLATIVGLLLLLLGAWSGLHLLFSERITGKLSRSSHIVLAALVLFAITQTVRYQYYLARPEMVVSSLFYKLQSNVQESLRVYEIVRTFDDNDVRHAYDYQGQRLITKPNVYLLFVESYGSVLYKRPDYLREYTALADELAETLAANGWHSATALSESPTWGGGSWMAYTSALFGLRIDNDPEYALLMDRYQVEDFPDLGSFLQGQGYRYYGLSSIARELSDEKWNRYLRFYGADRWLRYRDLDYVGPKYGWGPSPSDQYSLNKARTEILAETDQPYLLFTITQNTHYPWAPLPELVEDWTALNVKGDDPEPIDAEGIPHETRRRNYLNAVEYDLRVLVDFILNEEDPNALFILVGDHQPPRVSRKEDGWETPIHIISRDRGLIKSLNRYGFVPGLHLPPTAALEPAFQHAGIHSLVARLLLQRYGDHELALPEFLPDGVPFAGVLVAEPTNGESTP